MTIQWYQLQEVWVIRHLPVQYWASNPSLLLLAACIHASQPFPHQQSLGISLPTLLNQSLLKVCCSTLSAIQGLWHCIIPYSFQSQCGHNSRCQWDCWYTSRVHVQYNNSSSSGHICHSRGDMVWARGWVRPTQYYSCHGCGWLKHVHLHLTTGFSG